MQFNLTYFIAAMFTSISVLMIQLVMRGADNPSWLDPLMDFGPSFFGTLSGGLFIISLIKQKKNGFILGLLTGALWYEFSQINRAGRIFDLGDITAIIAAGMILIGISNFLAGSIGNRS